MIRQLSIYVRFIYFLSGCITLLMGQSAQSNQAARSAVTTRRDQYKQLSNQIYSFEDPESRRVHIVDKVRIGTITSEMHEIIKNEIVAALSTASPNVSSVVSAIKDIQDSTSLSSWDPTSTNTPFAEISELRGQRTLAIGYAILTGAAGIPNSTPWLEFYSESGGTWQLKAAMESDLTASTLFVQRMNSPLAGQSWYLVWGQRLGDTAGRLRLRLYGFDGNSIRTIWERNDLPNGVAQVSGQSVTLDYSKEYHSTEKIHEVLYITPSGLQ